MTQPSRLVLVVEDELFIREDALDLFRRAGLEARGFTTAAETLVRDIRYNMFRERWDVVQQALQVYNLAKVFTRNVVPTHFSAT